MGEQKRRLVLVGAGHSNTQVMLKITKEINDDLELIVVSDNEQSFYSGMLPGCVTGFYAVDEIAVSVPAFAKAKGWTFIQERAVGIRRDCDELCLANGETIAFDILCLDIGSQTSGSSEIPGVKDFAISSRPLTSLLTKIKEYEQNLTANLPDLSSPTRAVVIGGGAAGVELACALKERIHNLCAERLEHSNKTKDTTLVDVTLVTSSTSVLSTESPPMINEVESALKARKISLITSNRVESIDKDVIHLQDGTTVGYDLVVWAAGATPHKSFNQDGVLECDETGFICVNEYLQVRGRSNILGAGDCISFTNRTLPKAGVFAVRQGPILIHNINAILQNKKLRAYKPQKHFLKLINLTDGMGIGCKWGIVMKGKWVWKVKDHIDRKWMNLFATKE